jgi:hypothetical protein
MNGKLGMILDSRIRMMGIVKADRTIVVRDPIRVVMKCKHDHG